MARTSSVQQPQQLATPSDWRRESRLGELASVMAWRTVDSLIPAQLQTNMGMGLVKWSFTV